MISKINETQRNLDIIIEKLAVQHKMAKSR